MSNRDDKQDLRELITDISKGYQFIKVYLFSKYLTIGLFGILGSLSLFAYSLIKKPVFTATCTLVIEDTKNSHLSQFSDVASIAEYNMSGATGNGMFADENILQLYKSRNMIIKALFSEISQNGKKQLLINKYMDVFNLRKKWAHDKNLAHLVFDKLPDQTSRIQDSVIIDIVANINKHLLTVTKPTKQFTILTIEVKSTDEVFSKEFVDKLVENVSTYYINTRTQRSMENLTILQKQVDSIRQILHRSVGGVAYSIDAVPNANPTMIKLGITTQNKLIDVQATTTIYSEMVKNVEMAKIALRHEMPLIQVIDNPMYPLEVSTLGTLLSLILGFIGGVFLCVFGLLIKALVINPIRELIDSDDNAIL